MDFHSYTTMRDWARRADPEEPKAKPERVAAAEALGKISREAFPTVMELLKEESPEIRQAVASAMGYMRTEAESVVPLLRGTKGTFYFSSGTRGRPRG
jgi:HEAT repeat protein